MVRFRRIEDRDRIFFVTTNLARGVSSLAPDERDFFLNVLDTKRTSKSFLLLAYVVMPDHVHLLLESGEMGLIRIMRDI